MGELTIVVIAYNRPDSLERLLQSLKKVNWQNDKIRIHISIDKETKESVGYKETVKCAQEFEWEYGEKIVDCKEKNLGLKKHILQCGNLTNKYENIIILEDDIFVSPLMYEYAKQVIEYYKQDENIAGFGLYSFQRNPKNNLPFIALNEGTDVFFMQYACSWGQIWTKKQWNNFYNWYNENKDSKFENLDIPDNVRNWGEKSWLKFYTIYTIASNKFFVYPHIGLTTNFSDAGTHNQISNFAYQCSLYTKSDKDIKFRYIDIENANNVYDAYFENIKLDKLMGIEKNVVSDIYGEKDIAKINSNSYLLSSKIYNYKMIKQYSLTMYPYEQNLINDISGKEIMLYDLSQQCDNKKVKNKNYIIHRYLYKLDFLFKNDIKKICQYFVDDFKGRIYRKIKK